MNYRIERDSLGEVKVPQEAYWGAQTQRAIENFPISGLRFSSDFIRAIGLVKLCAARVNAQLKLLDERHAKAIEQAAREVVAGKFDAHFPIDIFQTGSGTSTNMNANEVIANRAGELLGSQRGDKTTIHPNDHVNLGQSSNDVIPSSVHISAAIAVRERLSPALEKLHNALNDKAREFAEIVKTGRTHLMDAMPITLGQQFSGYTAQIALCRERIVGANGRSPLLERLYELALGGTAVGTGINTHPEFGERIAQALAQETQIAFRETRNHFAAQATMETAVELSGALKTLAVALYKIANDLRWMNSGPQAGLAEIRLPALQPGSSIMPGKVNPVIPEAVMMVAMQVMGNDTVVTTAAASGNFELNVALPVIAHNLLQSVSILSNACTVLADKCVTGLMANRERMEHLAEQNAILATALAPHIGYDRAAEIVKKALSAKKTIREVALELKLLSPEKLDEILDIRQMTEGGFVAGVSAGG